ncbi:hypothetical protein [Desulfofundulus thermosubterraneus]|nr:hypothetical protein [Desulfofundulus thermosubterraneus]
MSILQLPEVAIGLYLAAMLVGGFAKSPPPHPTTSGFYEIWA